QHERVLVWGDVEEAMEFVQEDVGALREARGGGVRLHFVPHIEWVLRALRHLLGNEHAAGSERTILCEAMYQRWVVAGRGFGPGYGRGCHAIGQRYAALCGNPGNDPFEILLLVFRKAWVSRHLIWRAL